MEGTWLIDQRKEKWIAKLVAKPFGGGGPGRKGCSGELFRYHDRTSTWFGRGLLPESPRILGKEVLDTSLKDGHALGTGDFLGLGYDQVVAGWRAMGPSGKPGLKLFVPADKNFRNWKEFQLSSKEIAVEDLKVGDLDGDGKPEIVASGRQTHNLVILWNQSENP